MLRNISRSICLAHFQVYLQSCCSKHNERAWLEKQKRQFHISSSTEPDHQRIGWCGLPLWSAQSTSPNARWVPSTRLDLIKSSDFLLRFCCSDFFRKVVWNEGESLSLCFEYSYSRKQHNSDRSHSTRSSQSWFYVTNCTRPIPFRQVPRIGMVFWISIFRHFESSKKIPVLTKNKKCAILLRIIKKI